MGIGGELWVLFDVRTHTSRRLKAGQSTSSSILMGLISRSKKQNASYQQTVCSNRITTITTTTKLLQLACTAIHMHSLMYFYT